MYFKKQDGSVFEFDGSRHNLESLKNRFEDYIGEKINLKLLGTVTHFAITNLRKLFKFHSFLGYTATPNATLVINTFNNLSPSFGEIIEPGKDYTGLDYFFSKQSKIDRFVKYIEENIREYEDQNHSEDLFVRTKKFKYLNDYYNNN